MVDRSLVFMGVGFADHGILLHQLLIWSGVQVDVLRLPFGIRIDFGFVSFLFTILWVCGITNAVNLIPRGCQ